MKKDGKKQGKNRAAEQSVPKKPRSNRPKDAVKSKAGKASAAARRAKREKGDPVARPCSARRTNGEPCKNSAIRGGLVCARHGGSAPQVRAKANQRLIEMVLPAMRELHRILNDPTTADADKLKAINMVLNRTGYNERREIDLGLREQTPFDTLMRDAFTIRRGADLRDELEQTADPDKGLPSGGGVDDDTLDAVLDRRDRERSREASTHLDNRGHEVVEGEVIRQRKGMDPFFREEKEREEFARRTTEFDRIAPEDSHPETFEERVLRDAEDPPTPRRRGRRP